MRAWESVWPPPRDDEHDVPSSEADAPTPGGDVLLPPLTPMDRCDACRAQAYVRVRLADGGELLFCGHHGHELRPLLLQLGARLRDDTHLLTIR